MKNPLSTWIIVAISLFTGGLHFLIGPDYSGIFPLFMKGYLIDLVLPMDLYLLLQISLRKQVPLRNSRILGLIIPFAIGLTVEGLQHSGVELFGNTYDPLDILMYALGVVLGLLVDLLVIERLEKPARGRS